MSLDHLVVPGDREVLKKGRGRGEWRYVERSKESTLIVTNG